MTKRRTQQHMSSAAVLVLFAVFAVCVLALLLTGAQVYGRLTQRDDASYTARTAAQYISARVHQSGETSVVVEEFGGVTALAFYETYGTTPCVTRVYCHDGWLRELFSAADSTLSPADGEKLLALAGLDAALEEGVLTVTLTREDGSVQQLTFALRTGREGGA